jgi:hypothetical protein
MGLVPTFSKEFSLQLYSLFWFKGCPAHYPVGAVVFFCGLKWLENAANTLFFG